MCLTEGVCQRTAGLSSDGWRLIFGRLHQLYEQPLWNDWHVALERNGTQNDGLMFVDFGSSYHMVLTTESEELTWEKSKGRSNMRERNVSVICLGELSLVVCGTHHDCKHATIISISCSGKFVIV